MLCLWLFACLQELIVKSCKDATTQTDKPVLRDMAIQTDDGGKADDSSSEQTPALDKSDKGAADSSTSDVKESESPPPVINWDDDLHYNEWDYVIEEDFKGEPSAAQPV